MEEKKQKQEKKNAWVFIAIGILVVLVLVSVFTNGFSFNKNGEEIDNSPSNDVDSGINMNSLIDDDAIKGDPNAPVTIVEFSDYECPYCEKFYSQTLGMIDEEYIKTGKVKLIYRDFPLGFHANAQKAAEAAECAGEQDMYFEMHDMLFENGVSGGIDSFKLYASQLGLNTDTFNDCLDSGDMANEVRKDMADGQKAGVRGTPAFFINGEMVSGAQPFSVFQEIIERHLN